MYEFSSKSQLKLFKRLSRISCLRYCKCTSFQANHNRIYRLPDSMLLFAILQMYEFSSKSQLIHFIVLSIIVVCDTANVRVFKQITTVQTRIFSDFLLFAILQMYEFSSKSQLKLFKRLSRISCLRYCKCTSFQANHNKTLMETDEFKVVCDTANVRVFKQITTNTISSKQ